MPVGNGAYTFMTRHLPKEDLNLCHQHIDSVQTQMNDRYFLAEWERYEKDNRNARLAYYVREMDIRNYETKQERKVA